MHESTRPLHRSPDPLLLLQFAGTVSAAVGEDKPLHQHTCWELVYVRTGSIGCPIGDTFYEGEPGVLLSTPPATSHTEFARTAWSCFYCGIEAPAHMPWPRLCRDDADGTFAHLFLGLVREVRGQGTDRDTLLFLLLQQLSLHLRRMYEHPHLTPGERLVREAERLFHERLSAPLTITAVARELNVSPTVLRETFARWRGQAPLTRLHQLRVERAIALIRTSDLTLEAIAPLCGFDSASHLSRHVKRLTRRSPGTFRAGYETA